MFNGILIKTIREKRNITRQKFSELTGIPLRTLEDWECGRSEPSNIFYLFKATEVLHCNLNDFCKENNELYLLPNKYSQHQLEYIVESINEKLDQIDAQKRDLACNILCKIERSMCKGVSV